VWFEAISATYEAREFLSNCRIRGVGFEGSLHMPDRRVEIALIFPHNGHADVRNKIIGNCRENALKNIGSVSESLRFEIGFPEQAVGTEMFRVNLKDVATVCDSLIQLIAFYKVVNFFYICA
jgi:hypothetical protein